MSSQNRILRMAQIAFEENWTPNQWKQGVDWLFGADIPGEEVFQAIGQALQSEVALGILTRVIELCSIALHLSQQYEQLYNLTGMAGGHLLERGDRQSLLAACRYFEQLRRWLPLTSPQCALACSLEADAHRLLATINTDVTAHLRTAVDLYEKARIHLSSGLEKWIVNCLNESSARISLYRCGERIENHLETAGKLCSIVYVKVPYGSPYYGVACSNKAQVVLCRTDIHTALPEELIRAVAYCLEAKRCFPIGSEDLAIVCQAEARLRYQLALQDYDAVNNLRVSVELCEQAQNRGKSITSDGVSCWVLEAGVRRQLAEYNIRPESNLSQAVDLYMQARADMPDIHRDYLLVVIAEIRARESLSLLGKDPKTHLQKAIDLCEQMLGNVNINQQDEALLLALEGSCWVILECLGDTAANGQHTLQCFFRARNLLSTDSVDYPEVCIRECRARRRLAGAGIEPHKNLQWALDNMNLLRKCVSLTAIQRAMILMEEGIVLLFMAESGIEALHNAQLALQACDEGIIFVPTESLLRAHILFWQANARLTLASIGSESVLHSGQALKLYAEAKEAFTAGIPDYNDLLIKEAWAHLLLAQSGVDPGEHLAQALDLCQHCRLFFDASSLCYAMALMYEGLVKLQYAILGFETGENLSACLWLLGQAREHFDPQSQNYGRALANEGYAYALLANENLGEDQENLISAVRLCQQARHVLLPGSYDYTHALILEGQTHVMLAESGMDIEGNVLLASQCLSTAGELADPGTETFGLVQMHLAALARVKAKTAAPCDAVHTDDTVPKHIFASHFTRGSLQWANAQRNEAILLTENGNFEMAYQCLSEGIEVLEQVRTQFQQEKERVDYMENLFHYYRDIVSLCVDLATQTTISTEQTEWRWKAWHWVHRSKSRALLDLISGERPLVGGTEQALFTELKVLASQLDIREREIRRRTLYNSGSNYRRWKTQNPEELTDLLSDPDMALLLKEQAYLQEVYQEKRRLFQACTAGMTTAMEVPQPAQLLERLRFLNDNETDAGSRTLLVEFFMVGVCRIYVFLVALWDTEPPIIEYIEVPSESREEVTARLLQFTQGDEYKSIPKSDWDEVLQTLGDLFVTPWANHLTTLCPTQVILSPHFLLNQLPWHAIYWKGRPLIESLPISYLPSPVLATILGRPSRPNGGNALVLGNPTEDLDWAGPEAEEVSQILTAHDAQVLTLQQTQATTDQVFQYAPHAQLLHFACHSVLRHDDFLRSGLELADRRLTAWDITAGLKLTQAPLVYLSSCDSAESIQTFTDELYALIRTFLYAGAPSVIASLWNVDEEAGAYFAASFYENWLAQERSLAESFQKAMLATRREFNDPFCWAPFVLVGAWRDISKKEVLCSDL